MLATKNFWKIILLLASLMNLYAGQTGKIAGTVVDAKSGQPLPGVNVVVNELGIGASTDAAGYYYILNIAPGIYTVRYMMIGYATLISEEVNVAMEQTTQIDQQMTIETLNMDEIRVVATRPVVVKDLSATQLYVKEETISALPIDNISSVVGLQAGVSGVSVRGGASTQTAFIVDGFQLNDGRSNSPNLSLSLSSVKEVQVQSGGFNAEYGNVRSGIVNVITSEGSSDKYKGTLTYYYTPPAPKNYGLSPYDQDAYYLKPYLDDAVAWTGTQGESFEDLNANQEWDPGEPYQDLNGDGHWSGWNIPTQDQYQGFEGWNAYALRLLQDDDPSNDLTAAQAQREFIWKHRRTGFIVDPDYTLDFGFGGPVPVLRNYGNTRFYLSHQNSNTSFVVPLSRDGYQATTTRLKLNADISKSIKLTATAQYSVDRSVSPYSWTTTPTGRVLSSVYSVANLVSGGSNVLFMPDYYSPSDIYKSNFGVKLNHMLDQHSYYEVVYQYLHSKYWTFETQARDTTKLEIVSGVWRDEAPYGYDAGEWMNLGRDSSLTQTHSLKFDYTNQINTTNQYKTGILFKYSKLRIRSYTESDKDTWTRAQIYDQPPFSLAAYVQDKLEYEGFIANVGLRLEYNNPNAPVYLLDIYDPMYSQGLGSSLESDAKQQPAKGFWTLSPRLGISHPITNSSKLYFNYGHFHSTPASSYRYRLQREYNGQVTSIGNPNLELEQTVAYELGYSQGLGEDFLLNVATYYKDVTGQAGWVRYTNFDGSVNYIKPDNNNYEDIRGIEFTLSKLQGAWFSGFMNYTYMVKTSGYFGLRQHYENPVEQDDYDNINPQDSRAVPTPYARLNLVLHTPRKFGPSLAGFYPLMGWNISLLASYHTGSTWQWTEHNKPVERPWVNSYNMTARIARTFETKMGAMEFFVDVSNLLNTKWLSYSGFSGSKDWEAYRESLRLPWEDGVDRGSDRLGDYRSWDTEYRKFVTVDSLTGVQGTPRSYEVYCDKRDDSYHQWNDETNSWDGLSQSEIDDLISSKAYIDMPNIRSMTFLNPRQITLGIRLKF